MIHIFTPIKNGQAIMPNVMRGILNQSVECCLFPIASDGKREWSEDNRISNLVKAVGLNTNDYLLIMDSDVVLGDQNIIEEMIKKEGDMVALKTMPYQTCCHSVLLLRGKKITDFYYFITGVKVSKQQCLMCEFIRSNGGNDFSESVYNRVSSN